MMIPDKNAERRKVRFTNKTKRKLIGVRSEFDYDTIPKNSTAKYLHSNISMNCGFRVLKYFIIQ